MPLIPFILFILFQNHRVSRLKHWDWTSRGEVETENEATLYNPN